MNFVPTASQNELMRRDLESRIMAERNAGGPNTFLPGHPMIPHLSGVNHLPSPGGPALFPPPFVRLLIKLCIAIVYLQFV